MNEKLQQVARALSKAMATAPPGEGVEFWLARAAIEAFDGGWMPIDGAPREQIIMVFGVWCGEINGRDKEPDIYLAQREGGAWAVVGTDAYSATVDATHWRPLPSPPEALK